MHFLCWKCKKPVSEPQNKVGFRSTCSHCGRDLHTCMGCKYYAPGKPNDCLVPGTEFIRDREANNFCEEFKPKTDFSDSNKDKSKFNSLFKEE